MKQAVIALVLIAVGSWLAHLHVASQTYYPVVRVTSTEGIVYTTVQSEVLERRACGAANDRFLKPIKEVCKQCQVVYARCERKLEGFELALFEGAAIPHPQVLAPGLRIAIAGPDAIAKATCSFIAGDMVKRGVRGAACIFPKSS
jgi:hypothetical protein